MATTQVAPDIRATNQNAPARGYSTLDLIILAGLALAIVDYVAALLQAGLLAGHIIPPVLGLVIGYLISAVVVATRWRWSMIVSLIVGLVALVIHLTPGGFPLYAIAHPSPYAPFAEILLQSPLMVMVVVASVVKLAQTLRHTPVRAPRWLAPAIGVLAGFAIGALLIGAVAQPTGAGGAATATSTGHGTETVHLTGATFAPDIIALHTGDTLTVVDDVPVPHILTNGSWSASNQAMPGAESGAPVVNNVNLNGNTVTIGPFTTAGTFHIFCTVHPGMNLTVIVQ